MLGLKKSKKKIEKGEKGVRVRLICRENALFTALE